MIGLKLTLINGTTTTNETEFFFDHKHAYIVLGCDPQTCDIVFVDHHKESGVGNEHIAFKRSLGRYQIDLNTNHAVEIDGEIPFEDQEISGKSIIVLGNDVTVEVEVIDNRKSSAEVGKKHIQPGAQVKHQRKYLQLAFIGIVALGVVAFLFNQNLTQVEDNIAVSQENISQTVDKFTELSEELTRIENLSSDISPETIARVTKSVYLVLVQHEDGGERPAGTAWVFNDEQLATNAHVAEAFNSLKNNEKLIVRAPNPPYKTHTVRNAFLHPGYKLYSQMWQDYLPTQKVGNYLNVMRTAAPADVAVLTLENHQGLNPAIELLGVDELDQIIPGIKVAFVGYPGERLLPGSYKTPTPVAQQDEIIRVTDFFLTKQKNNRLLHHGLPLTGGASGSPMFNKDGKVIGLISAMNITRDANGRAPNAADVNIGQRIDFLYDLIGGDTDGAVQNLRNQWQASLSNYYSASRESYQMIVQKLTDMFALENNAKVNRIVRNDVVAPTRNNKITRTEKIYINEPGLHAVLLSSKATVANFSVKHEKDKNISVFKYPIKYSNFTNYRLIIANEPGEVAVTFSVSNRLGKDRILSYQLDQLSWQRDINTLAQSYMVALGHVISDDKTPFSLIKQANQLPMSKKIKSTFFTGFSFPMTQKGYYAFLSVPQTRGQVDIMLVNNKSKIEKKDNTTNGLGYAIYKNDDPKKSLRFISMATNGNLVQNMSVYYMPLPESISE